MVGAILGPNYDWWKTIVFSGVSSVCSVWVGHAVELGVRTLWRLCGCVHYDDLRVVHMQLLAFRTYSDHTVARNRHIESVIGFLQRADFLSRSWSYLHVPAMSPR